MRPAWTVLALALFVAPVAEAQAVFGGVLEDEKSDRPMRCVRVMLEDTTGRVTDSTWTRSGGRFQFVVPEAGAYRLRFRIGGMADFLSAWETLASDTTVAHAFRIPFSTNPVAVIAAMPTPLRMKPGSPTPSYPESLRLAATEGDVTIAFVVDTSGRVDEASLIPIRATNETFLRAVMSVVPRHRYEPFAPPSGRDCTLTVERFYFRMQTPRSP